MRRTVSGADEPSDEGVDGCTGRRPVLFYRSLMRSRSETATMRNTLLDSAAALPCWKHLNSKQALTL
jgi:hypothetical protein